MNSRPEPDSKPLLRAAIYARISLDRSGEGAGITRQVSDCMELIEANGWDHVTTYSENSVSASTGKRRKKYESMLSAIDRGEIDVVVAWSNDRLHRRLDELERYAILMERSGCLTETVKSGSLNLGSAAGKLVARLLGSVAAAETDMKSERIRRRRQQEAHLGKAHGPLGYGYNPDRTVNLTERAIVLEVAQRLLAGETLYSVASDLTARGVASPGAGKWTSLQVERTQTTRREVWPLVEALRSAQALTPARAAILLRKAGATDITTPKTVAASTKVVQWLLTPDAEAPDGQIAVVLTAAGIAAPPTSWRASNLGVMIRRGALCGWRDFGPGKRGGRGEMVAQGDWTPILTKDVSEAIRSLLDSRKAPLRHDGKPRGGRPAKFLLAGVLTCGRCGHRMSGYTDTASGRSKYSCTRVPGTPRCGRLSITGPVVEEAVEAVIKAALSGSAWRRPTVATDSVTVDAAAAEVMTIRAQIATYRNMAGQGRISPEDFAEIRADLNARMRAAERLLGDTGEGLRAALEGVPETSPELDRWWEAATLGRRRDVIKALVKEIPIAPAVPKAERDASQSALLAPGALVRSRIGVPVWRA